MKKLKKVELLLFCLPVLVPIGYLGVSAWREHFPYSIIETRRGATKATVFVEVHRDATDAEMKSWGEAIDKREGRPIIILFSGDGIPLGVYDHGYDGTSLPARFSRTDRPH